MEVILETLETLYIDMNPSHSMIEPIVNNNFGNKLKHHNVTNQRQHTNKNTSHQYQHSKTRQQYHHKNTGQQPQHINTSPHYQPRSFQRTRTSSIPYMKENFLGCVINNKGVIELSMQSDLTLDNFPFRGPLYIHAKATR